MTNGRFPVSFKLWRQDILIPQVMIERRERKERKDGSDKHNKDKGHKHSNNVELSTGLVPCVTLEYRSGNDQYRHNSNYDICQCHHRKQPPHFSNDYQSEGDEDYRSDGTYPGARRCSACRGIYIPNNDHCRSRMHRLRRSDLHEGQENHSHPTKVDPVHHLDDVEHFCEHFCEQSCPPDCHYECKHGPSCRPHQPLSDDNCRELRDGAGNTIKITTTFRPPSPKAVDDFKDSRKIKGKESFHRPERSHIDGGANSRRQRSLSRSSTGSPRRRRRDGRPHSPKPPPSDLEDMYVFPNRRSASHCRSGVTDRTRGRARRDPFPVGGRDRE